MSSQKTLRSFKIRDLEAYNKFMELCRREGQSASKKLETWIQEYVKDHYPGNPQVPIDRYLHPPPPKVLCPENCRTGVDRSWSDCSLRRRYVCRFG